MTYPILTEKQFVSYVKRFLKKYCNYNKFSIFITTGPKEFDRFLTISWKHNIIDIYLMRTNCNEPHEWFYILDRKYFSDSLFEELYDYNLIEYTCKLTKLK